MRAPSVALLRSVLLICWLAVGVQSCLPGHLDVLGLGVRPLLCVVTGMAACLAWTGGLRWTGRQRLGWLLLAAGITCYAVGYLLVFCDPHHRLPGPWGMNLSDFVSLLLYPLGYLGLSVLALSRHRQQDRAALLEAALVAAGAGAVAVVLVHRLYPDLFVGPALTVVYDIAYAVGGFTLLVGAVTALAVSGWRMERSWVWLCAGLSAMTVGDAAYGLASAAHTFRFGTWSELFYTAGPVGVALAASGRPVQAPLRVADPRPAMAVTALATLTAIGTLVAGQFTPVPTAAVLLAAACAVLAVARTGQHFQQGRLLEQSRALARTDELTGLPNRRALGEELASTARSRQPFVVLLVDLDGFKDVNDSFGHAAGDELLAAVAGRLRRVAWPSTVCRLGGDEFAVLHVGDSGTASALGSALREAILLPITVQDVALVIGASVGVGPAAGSEAGAPGSSEALRRADVALYRAKESGSGMHVWEPGMDAGLHEHARLVAELRAALDSSDQIVAHFQPQADAGSGTIVGFEALVRWQHPQRGLLLPAEFLDSAERARLLPGITQLMLHQSLAALQLLSRAHPRLTVSVNVGAGDLLDQALPEKVRALLRFYDVPPARLVIEVTETVVLTNPEQMIRVLDRLRDLGVRIALDDYGTGLSSLSYLRTLPLDELKIDRSLITDLETNAASALIVGSTIQLAHGLGLRVVVEGVEQARTAALLARLGCDVTQGWFIGRPTPVGGLDALLRVRPPVPVSR